MDDIAGALGSTEPVQSGSSNPPIWMSFGLRPRTTLVHGIIPTVTGSMRRPEPSAREGSGWHVFENLANQENSDSTAVDQMSHEQRMVFALNMLRQGSTDSGGFGAYFRHAGGKTTPQAAEAARIVAHEQALSSAELDHSVDVFNVEVGDGPRALGDDVTNTDPMRRHVVGHEPPRVYRRTPRSPVRNPQRD